VVVSGLEKNFVAPKTFWHVFSFE